MKKFSTVEEYLEVIAGKRDYITGHMRPLGWLGTAEFKPMVNLARYDVSFLDSVTDATLGGKALTDRQAELAVKLVLKYTKQLSAKGIEVFAEGTEQYRIPLRVIDRKKSIEVHNGELHIKFPYEQKLIECIRENAKASQGRVHFNREAKVWQAAYTEYNVNWLSAFAEAYQFEVDKEFSSAMDLILECEKTSYKIELAQKDNYLTIENASPGLLEYLGNEENKFDLSDAVRLIDLSTTLGYTVADSVIQDCTDGLGNDMAIMLTRREYDFKTYNWPSLERSVYKYAELTNRFPIVVFDPQQAFDSWREFIDADDILDMTTVRTKDDAQVCQNITAKVVLTNRAIKSLDRVPLLVSHMGMIVGQDKRIMIDASEKVFYRNGKLA